MLPVDACLQVKLLLHVCTRACVCVGIRAYRCVGMYVAMCVGMCVGIRACLRMCAWKYEDTTLAMTVPISLQSYWLKNSPL